MSSVQLLDRSAVPCSRSEAGCMRGCTAGRKPQPCFLCAAPHAPPLQWVSAAPGYCGSSSPAGAGPPLQTGHPQCQRSWRGCLGRLGNFAPPSCWRAGKSEPAQRAQRGRGQARAAAEECDLGSGRHARKVLCTHRRQLCRTCNHTLAPVRCHRPVQPGRVASRSTPVRPHMCG